MPTASASEYGAGACIQSTRFVRRPGLRAGVQFSSPQFSAVTLTKSLDSTSPTLLVAQDPAIYLRAVGEAPDAQ